jgi:hypothetical protein
MKFTIKPEDLTSASAFVAAHLEKNPGSDQAVLGYTSITAGGDGATFMVTSGDGTAVMTAPASVGEPGQVLVPGRLLADLAAKLPRGKGDAEMFTAGTGCALTCGPADFVLRMFAGDDIDAYPVVRPAQEVIGICGGADLASALSRLAGFSAHSIADPRFYAIEFAPEVKGARLAASDAYRLADVWLPWTKDAAGWNAAPILIPSRALAAVARSFSSEDDVSIAVTTVNVPAAAASSERIRQAVLVTLATATRSLTCNVIASNPFADGYRRFLPACSKAAGTAADQRGDGGTTFPASVTAGPADLLDALNRVLIPAGTIRAVPVELALADPEMITIRLATEVPDHAGNRVEHGATNAVAAEVTGVGEVAYVSPAYLRDTLQACAGATLVTIVFDTLQGTAGQRRLPVLPVWAEGDPCPARYMIASVVAPAARAAA